MLPQVNRQPEIADIVALACAHDRDEQRSAAELMVREKRFAVELPTAEEDRTAVALHWLEWVQNEDEAVRSIHQRATTALHLTGLAIVVAGIFCGGVATLGAFYFDGSGRVNAVSVLALLVALPGLFLIPFLVAALPARLTQKVPGAGLVIALGHAFSPGRLAPWLWRIMPRDLRESMTLVAGQVGRHRHLYASLQKWAILRWSQLFALTFQLTALGACLLLVVFTDLAFGWSTTLTTGDAELDAQRVHRATTAMALPWRAVQGEAQPSLELIGESRYFRAAATSLSSAQAARLGGWWQFVALTIGIYGLMPRLITFALARNQLRAATRAAVEESPGLSAVLRRLHRARVESVAIEPEQGGKPVAANTAGNVGLVAAVSVSSGQLRAVINWSGVPVGGEGLRVTFPHAKFYAAGGASSVADEGALAQKLGAILEGTTDAIILIVVKGWEPPLMEFIDFITTLRGALSSSSMTAIVVLPVGLSDGTGLTAATSTQVELWRKKLAGLSDPRLRVATNWEEVGS